MASGMGDAMPSFPSETVKTVKGMNDIELPSSESDEEFEDALDALDMQLPEPPELDIAIDAAAEALPPLLKQECSLEEELSIARRAMELFVTGKIEESENLLLPRKDSCMYHALGSAIFSCVRAFLTLDRDLVTKALGELKEAANVCGRYRHRVTVTDMVTWRKTKYTVTEAHAELCYAECILARAALTFLEDETLVAFVKAGLQIRSGYYAYKNCWQLVAEENDVKEEVDFISGVRLGVGTYNLLISMLPNRILKILEWVGFTGSKKFGMSQLNKVFALNGLRQPLAVLVIVIYNLFACIFFGVGDVDYENCDRILENFRARYPASPFVLFLCGRRMLIDPNLSIAKAIPLYEQARDAQKVWPQVHHACYWELMWCHMYQCRWSEAAKFAELLFGASKWSPATFAYFKAANLLMKDYLSKEEEQELENLILKIPPLKRRIAGKSVPIEKFAVARSEQYWRLGKTLVLPGLELIYLWNGFVLIGSRKEPIERILKITDEMLLKLQTERSFLVAEDKSILALCSLLKGCCYRCLGDTSRAMELFEETLAFKGQLGQDSYIPPYVTTEIALLDLAEGRCDEAKAKLKDAMNNYKGYALESRNHFRIHAALKKIYRETAAS